MNWTTEGVYFTNSLLRGCSIQEGSHFARADGTCLAWLNKTSELLPAQGNCVKSLIKGVKIAHRYKKHRLSEAFQSKYFTLSYIAKIVSLCQQLQNGIHTCFSKLQRQKFCSLKFSLKLNVHTFLGWNVIMVVVYYITYNFFNKTSHSLSNRLKSSAGEKPCDTHLTLWKIRGA